jgi:hypothetical protein
MGWDDPVVGGVALRRAAIQSPNYAAGTTGWTINQDGSAEFSNATIRGTITASTFQGTDFVINSSGFFVYSGVPAAGNLIASIAPVGGADSFGNHYPAGFMSQSGETDGSSFAQLFNGNLFLGALASGSQDVLHAALLTQVVSSALVALESPTTVSAPSAGELRMAGGASSQTTGSATAPVAAFLTGDLTGAIDVLVPGSVRNCSAAGVPVTLQTPAYGSNWADSSTFNGSANWGPLRWRADAENNILIGGAFKAGGVLPGAAVMNIPAPYRPAAQYPLICARNNGGTLTTGFMLALTTGGNLDVITQTGGGIAINNEYLVPPQLIPIGNLP